MIIFRDSPLEIKKDTPTELVYTYKDKEYTISKTPITDNPYSMTWDGFEEDEMVTANDGYACSDNGYILKYPTLSQIFSDIDYLYNALYYRLDHEDLNWYDDILDKLTIWDIYEGFYFGGVDKKFHDKA